MAQSLGTKYVLDAEALGRLREVLRTGGLVVHPTDTVYGLGADPFQRLWPEPQYPSLPAARAPLAPRG